jgi:hypothetical protein
LGQPRRQPPLPQYPTEIPRQLICLDHVGRFRRLRLMVYGL